jgi:methionyl-tRNA formyltransferase
MKKEDLRIIFMGTPEFAVETLKALVENQYNVVAVVTQPDKPVGRHQNELQPSEVKKFAMEHNLPVLQPEKMKDPAFVESLRSYRANLQVVVAFRMLPEVVWAMPQYGTFNVHAALLPQYRGAAPINWAVINGETETGITTFFLKHEIDTGKIIQQVRVPIHETDNVEDVHDRLMLLGGQLVTETVDNILAGTIQPIDQSELVGDDVELKPAPKIFHETCQINWNQPMKKVYDFIRGLSPYPAAWSEFEDAKGKKQSVKIFSTSMVERVFTASELMPKPGEMLTDGKTYLHVMCQNGLLSINELQMAGKKRMPIADFLRGFEMKERMAFIASDC